MFIDKNFKKVNHEIFEKINELYQPEDLANFIASLKGEKARRYGDQWRVGNKKNGGSLTVGKDGNKTVWHDFETGEGGDVCDAYATFGNMSLSNAAQTACKKLNLYFDESYFIDPKDYIDRAKDIIESRGIDFEFVKTQNVGYLDPSICKKYKGYYIKGRCLIFGNNKTEKIIEFENNATAGYWKRTEYVRQTNGNLQFYADCGDNKSPIIAVEGEFDALAVAMCGFNAIANANGDNADYCFYDCDDKGNENTCGKPDIRYMIKDVGVKDPNDALLKLGKEELKKRLQEAVIKELKKGSCTYEENPFKDECFLLPTNIYYKCHVDRIEEELKNIYSIQGKCNGRLVINLSGRLISVTVERLMRRTTLVSEKENTIALTKTVRTDLIERLGEIREQKTLKTIPIMPVIPKYNDVKKSAEFADEIENVYKSFVDKNNKSSLRQYMRVLGFILSGKFWHEGDNRVFLNIVSEETGIGKSGLFADVLLKNLKLFVAKVLRTESTNQFTYADFCKQDVLVFDDLTDENVKGLLSVLTNCVNNRAGRSEQKSAKAIQISDYRPFIIVTGNREFFIKDDTTGLNYQKRLLVKFIETKRNEKNMKQLSSNLILKAEKNPGIEMVFLQRCLEVYREEPDINDLLCVESKDEVNARDFDLFASIYGAIPIIDSKKGLVNMARTFSGNVVKDDVKPIFIEHGRFNEKRLAGVFASIITRLRTDDRLDIKPISASLRKEIIVDKGEKILWSKKCYNSSCNKNLWLTLDDWNKVQDWLRNIDPTREDESPESPNSKSSVPDYDDDSFF